MLENDGEYGDDDENISPNDADLTVSEPLIDFDINQADDASNNARKDFENIAINTYALNDGGGRLEFIFENPPQYQATVNETNISVTFDRPFTAKQPF